MAAILSSPTKILKITHDKLFYFIVDYVQEYRSIITLRAINIDVLV